MHHHQHEVASCTHSGVPGSGTFPFASYVATLSTRTSQAAGDVDDALRGRRPAFADPGRDVSRYVGVSGTP